jgi:hypothetical protein
VGQTQILLLAARTLRPPFTLAELAVAAWALAPERFGLRGFGARHPDAGRVGCLLSHKSGPVRRGLLARLGPGRYELTPAGRDFLHNHPESNDDPAQT